MKKLINVLICVLLTVNVFAQAPQKMSYQAAIRNGNNALVTSSTVGVRLSILQGTATGTPVYVETQNPTTNANGLASLEIGSGTVVSGTFSAINWANGPYFIKTETDPTGGTSYTIIGTSEFLSVPYALYAKKAEHIEVYEYKICEGHFVGELFGGGIVYWVDHTGQHGLICSMKDIKKEGSLSEIWSNVATYIGESAQSDWNGKANTDAIINQSGHTNSAAKLCDDYINIDYGTGIYTDWYMPSRGELNDLWNNIKAVQKALDSFGYTSLWDDYGAAVNPINKGIYLSSSEHSNNGWVWSFSFEEGRVQPLTSKSVSYSTRAIRLF